MKCLMCLVAYQAHEQERVLTAEYTYEGKSLCQEHINVVRGLDREFSRYPKPFQREWWEHMKDAHDIVIHIGDPEAEHAEKFTGVCTWTPADLDGVKFFTSTDLEQNRRRQRIFEYGVEDEQKRVKQRQDRIRELQADLEEHTISLESAQKTLALLQAEEKRMKS